MTPQELASATRIIVLYCLYCICICIVLGCGPQTCINVFIIDTVDQNSKFHIIFQLRTHTNELSATVTALQLLLPNDRSLPCVPLSINVLTRDPQKSRLTSATAEVEVLRLVLSGGSMAQKV